MTTWILWIGLQFFSNPAQLDLCALLPTVENDLVTAQTIHLFYSSPHHAGPTG